MHDADPLQEQASEVFAEQLAADRVLSIRAIRRVAIFRRA
jgi:hypothetical protein